MSEQLPLEGVIQRLYEDDRESLRREQTRLDSVYATLPHFLNETAAMMNISAEQLAKLAKSTTLQHPNVKWYEVVRIFHSFFSFKRFEDNNATN
jgi:hypothetical protein